MMHEYRHAGWTSQGDHAQSTEDNHKGAQMTIEQRVYVKPSLTRAALLAQIAAAPITSKTAA